jgi:hypothetical protein
MGVMRGFLNLREGHPVKGAAELITAVIPGVPTVPIHAAIEYIWPNQPGDKTGADFSGGYE